MRRQTADRNRDSADRNSLQIHDMTATSTTPDKWHWLHRGNKFLAKRLSTDTYVGLHLTVSFLVAAIAIWVGSELLDAVLDNRTLVHYDIVVATWIHGHVNPTGIAVSQLISEIGSPTTMGVIAVIGGAIVIWRRRFTLLVAWIAAFGGGGLLEKLLKVLVHRHRPRFTPTGPEEVSLSFPSGHTMMCMIGVSMVLYALFVPKKFGNPWRGIIGGVGVALVLAVGISRVYLGAHYPSDVLGGMLAGAGWVAICVGVRGIAKHQQILRRDRRKKARSGTGASAASDAR
jgi:membrane-associated phospholipid phosphatase